MPLVTILFGIVLIALGAEGYTNTLNLFHVQVLHAKTSLIPAYFGAALVLLGIIAYKPGARKHAMHLAAMVGLLGIIGGLGMGLPKLLRGELGERAAAVKMQCAMGIICALFVILCIKSFIDARRRRAQAQ